MTVHKSSRRRRLVTVRRLSEQVAGLPEATLVRINLRESHGPGGTLSLPMRAREALEHMDELVGEGALCEAREELPSFARIVV